MALQITLILRGPLTYPLHLFRVVLVMGCHSTYWESEYASLGSLSYTLSYSFR